MNGVEARMLKTIVFFIRKFRMVDIKYRFNYAGRVCRIDLFNIICD